MTVILSLGLACLGSLMLGPGWLFDTVFASGFPAWLHTIVGFGALAPGLVVLSRTIVRLPRRVALLWVRRRHITLFSIGTAAVLIALAWLWRSFRPLPTVPGASRGAVEYLLTALCYMERGYLHRDRVSWRTVRAAALQRIANAKSPHDTYPAIRQALSDIADGHSGLLEPHWRDHFTQTTRASGSAAPHSISPSGRLTADNLAYVVVPWQVGRGWGSLYFLNDPNARAYARCLRTLLRDLDAQRPLGWVVDLRANAGGNIWPMLDGLGPLLGEGRISAIVMPQFGRRIDTWLVAGRASSGPPWLAGLGVIGPQGLLLRTASPPVAVLVGPRTASAGEAVAVAFRGRLNTYFVGLPTAGLATSTQSFSLPDGAELLLTIGTLADRIGRQYEGPIPPDAHVPATEGQDEALIVASRWIRNRPR